MQLKISTSGRTATLQGVTNIMKAFLFAGAAALPLLGFSPAFAVTNCDWCGTNTASLAGAGSSASGGSGAQQGSQAGGSIHGGVAGGAAISRCDGVQQQR